ncbi:hypothetical protein BLNAU_11554 [Blattamonas nauphoetae]|uniref:Uncharacterized protein n=1 Tax=Blattamonas nauphoetae TaxID=2049346 RepID=A0ABQ9XP76_9EUKA|nr:hypothetical protein BLNAU_11554 [Blattamonas nauphoetae]
MNWNLAFRSATPISCDITDHLLEQENIDPIPYNVFNSSSLNTITERGARMITQSIIHCPSLEFVDFSGNPIPQTGVSAIFSILSSPSTSGLSNLRYLSVSVATQDGWPLLRHSDLHDVRSLVRKHRKMLLDFGFFRVVPCLESPAGTSPSPSIPPSKRETTPQHVNSATTLRSSHREDQPRSNSPQPFGDSIGMIDAMIKRTQQRIAPKEVAPLQPPKGKPPSLSFAFVQSDQSPPPQSHQHKPLAFHSLPKRDRPPQESLDSASLNEDGWELVVQKAETTPQRVPLSQTPLQPHPSPQVDGVDADQIVDILSSALSSWIQERSSKTQQRTRQTPVLSPASSRSKSPPSSDEHSLLSSIRVVDKATSTTPLEPTTPSQLSLSRWLRHTSKGKSYFEDVPERGNPYADRSDPKQTTPRHQNPGRTQPETIPSPELDQTRESSLASGPWEDRQPSKWPLWDDDHPKDIPFSALGREGEQDTAPSVWVRETESAREQVQMDAYSSAHSQPESLPRAHSASLPEIVHTASLKSEQPIPRLQLESPDSFRRSERNLTSVRSSPQPFSSTSPIRDVTSSFSARPLKHSPTSPLLLRSKTFVHSSHSLDHDSSSANSVSPAQDASPIKAPPFTPTADTRPEMAFERPAHQTTPKATRGIDTAPRPKYSMSMATYSHISHGGFQNSRVARGLFENAVPRLDRWNPNTGELQASFNPIRIIPRSKSHTVAQPTNPVVRVKSRPVPMGTWNPEVESPKRALHHLSQTSPTLFGSPNDSSAQHTSVTSESLSKSPSLPASVLMDADPLCFFDPADPQNALTRTLFTREMLERGITPPAIAASTVDEAFSRPAVTEESSLVLFTDSLEGTDVTEDVSLDQPSEGYDEKSLSLLSKELDNQTIMQQLGVTLSAGRFVDDPVKSSAIGQVAGAMVLQLMRFGMAAFDCREKATPLLIVKVVRVSMLKQVERLQKHPGQDRKKMEALLKRGDGVEFGRLDVKKSENAFLGSSIGDVVFNGVTPPHARFEYRSSPSFIPITHIRHISLGIETESFRKICSILPPKPSPLQTVPSLSFSLDAKLCVTITYAPPGMTNPKKFKELNVQCRTKLDRAVLVDGIQSLRGLTFLCEETEGAIDYLSQQLFSS